MKRFLRKTLLLLVVCGLCLSLMGCDALDDARRHHGVYIENGGIRLGEHNYFPLPPTDLLYHMMRWENGTVYITEADVPVLLKDMFGTPFSLSKDNLILYCDIVNIGEDSATLYCREDRHKEISARLMQGFVPDGYCYNYDAYDAQTDTVVTSTFQLTEVQKNTVRHLLSSVTPTVYALEEDPITHFEFCLPLQECSSDLLFQRYAFDLYVAGDTYTISYYDQKEVTVYDVPQEFNSLFEQIVLPFRQAEDSWSSKHYEEDIIAL